VQTKNKKFKNKDGKPTPPVVIKSFGHKKGKKRWAKKKNEEGKEGRVCDCSLKET